VLSLELELPAELEALAEEVLPAGAELFPEVVVPTEEVLPSELDLVAGDPEPVSAVGTSVGEFLLFGFASVGLSTEKFKAVATTSGGAGLSWSPALPRGRSRTTVVFCCTTTTTKCWMITGASLMTVTGRRCSSGHVCPV
jgi:hypothetical protein